MVHIYFLYFNVLVMMSLCLTPGPCQFPTLGFVVERFKENRDFVPEDFWKIEFSYQEAGGINICLDCEITYLLSKCYFFVGS